MLSLTTGVIHRGRHSGSMICPRGKSAPSACAGIRPAVILALEFRFGHRRDLMEVIRFQPQEETSCDALPTRKVLLGNHSGAVDLAGLFGV